MAHIQLVLLLVKSMLPPLDITVSKFSGVIKQRCESIKHSSGMPLIKERVFQRAYLQETQLEPVIHISLFNSGDNGGNTTHIVHSQSFYRLKSQTQKGAQPVRSWRLLADCCRIPSGN